MKYRMKHWGRALVRYLLQDFSYKTVALAVALVLWITLLSRRDTTSTFEMPIQFLTESNYEVVGQPIDQVKIDVAGPRMALKKFSQTEQIYTLDLSALKSGSHRVRLSREGIVVPVGVKVSNVRPAEISITLRSAKTRDE